MNNVDAKGDPVGAPTATLAAATDAQRAPLVAFLEAWEPGLAERMLKQRTLATWQQDGHTVLGFVAGRVLDLPGALRAGEACVALGMVAPGNQFLPVLPAATAIAACARRGLVRVNEKAAQLFVYGRNVLGGSVLAGDPKLRAKDLCVVVAEDGRALGLGIVVGSFKGRKEAVRPLHDLGAYLREEGGHGEG